MTTTADRLDIIEALEDLRREYVRRGYQAQDTVSVLKGGNTAKPDYNVRHNGVLLGWTANINGAWQTYLVAGIGKGTLIDAARTRRDAVNEIVWQAGKWENACVIAERHIALTELGVQP